MITYDNHPEIVRIYEEYEVKHYDLNYSVADKRVASEIIIFPNSDIWPTQKEMEEKKISINLR